MLLTYAVGLGSISPAAEPSPTAPGVPVDHRGELTLRVAPLAALADRGDLLRALPDPTAFGVERIVALEDNPAFMYFCGVSGSSRPAGASDPDIRPPEPAPCGMSELPPGHVRRIVLLKPGVVVVDDQVRGVGRGGVSWTLRCNRPLTVRGGETSGTIRGTRFVCRRLRLDAGTSRPRPAGAEAARLLHLLAFRPDGDPAVPETTLRRAARTVHLELSGWDRLLGGRRTARLSLPEGPFSGKIAIIDGAGEGLLDVPSRPLPAGVLPLGEAGWRMVQGWDAPYRDLSQGLAIWDTGHPSSQLKRVVEQRIVRPCRAVELGCGTGSDAVYLARQGFNVTAIDIAPTALTLAEKKAEEAEVEVRWLLADALRPPELRPFDFLYDRGCYHAVRRDHPRRYVAAVRRLTRPGSRVLILAGSANEDPSARFAGPPRVAESQIRADFAEGFKLLRLREFRFDPASRQKQGAQAWFVLLQRTGAEPGL